MLQDTNQIFYVPRLDFLEPGKWSYPHEYLIHGVKGPWHKALPYLPFTNLWVCHHLSLATNPVVPLTNDDIHHARKIGELFGSEFAIPITLAILSFFRRNRDLLMHGVSTKGLDTVVRGIKGLKIPESWHKRHPVVGRAISPQNFNDTKQRMMLIRALMRHLKRIDLVK